MGSLVVVCTLGVGIEVVDGGRHVGHMCPLGLPK